jgi:glycosyltransferase involved in cell wall biosynthesis
MSISQTRPLLTFAVCSFNQERFIGEAVEAALAQTYAPLEVVLSDDCSKDKTFEIMRGLAASYRGPHSIVLNRNPANLGIGRHVNRLVELTRGKLLVVAAGDDISLPERTETIYKLWEGAGCRTMVMQSGYIDIDEDGRLSGNSTNRDESRNELPPLKEEKTPLEDYVRTLQPGMMGCALAYDPTIFSVFGPLPETLIHEDNAVALRALVMGPLGFSDVPLLKRRIHGNNLFSRRHEVVAGREAVIQQEARVIRDARNRVTMYDAFLADLAVAKRKGLIDEAQAGKIETECIRQQRLFSYQVQYADASIPRKFQLLKAARKDRATPNVIKWMLLRLMPATLFRSLKVAGNSLRLAVKTPSRKAA